jgi:hypothetical protein
VVQGEERQAKRGGESQQVARNLAHCDLDGKYGKRQSHLPH